MVMYDNWLTKALKHYPQLLGASTGHPSAPLIVTPALNANETESKGLFKIKWGLGKGVIPTYKGKTHVKQKFCCWHP